MPTGINVGGVNIAIGVDTSKIDGGIKDALATVKNFKTNVESTFTKINLGGLVKGDPFSATKKYAKEMSKEFNNFFDTWAGNLDKSEPLW